MSVEFLQTWFQLRCNGFWEHSFGVTIETLDNPGWIVTVDLAETAWANKGMEPLRRGSSDEDWIWCEVVNEQFRGQGDSQKLGEILKIFQDWTGDIEIMDDYAI